MEDVDPAEPLGRLRDQRLDLCRVADVAGDEERLSALVLDQPDRLAPERLVDVGDDHPGAVPHHLDRRRAADPLGAAGDDRDLALEIRHQVSLVSAERAASDFVQLSTGSNPTCTSLSARRKKFWWWEKSFAPSTNHIRSTRSTSALKP